MGLTYDELKFLKNEQEKSLARPSVNIRTPQSRIADLPTQPQEEFGTLEVLKAGFLEENTLASTVSTILNGNYGDQEEDPEYDIVGKLEGTKYEPYFENFIGQVYNDKQFEHIAGKIDREEERDRILDSAGGFGIVSRIAGAVFDPINLIYIGGTAYKLFNTGKTLKGIARGVEVGVISEAATEGILQSQQETRTLEESAINIAGGAIFGGIIGGAAGALSKTDFEKMAEGLTKEMQDLKPKNNISGIEVDSVGAARVVDDPEASKLAGGKLTQGLIKSTQKLNPMLRILNSPSQKARELLPNLVRTNMYFKSEKGVQSVEINLKQYDAGLGRSITGGRDIFKQLRKRQKQEMVKPISIENFYDQVSLAMIRGDKSDIPEVEKAANLYRKEVFEPIKQKAIDAGVLDKNVDVKTATSYLMRQYNTRKIVARSNDFKSLIRSNAKNNLIPELKQNISKKQEAIITQINDVNTRALEIEDLFKKESSKKLKQAQEGLEPQQQLSDDELFNLLDKYKEARKIDREVKPKSLLQFIKENGGIHDEGGELAARDLQKQTVSLVRKNRFSNKVSKNGDQVKKETIDNSMEAVAQRAWEAGYFPELVERPTINDLLEAIDQELAGNKVFSEFDLDKIEAKQFAEDVFQQIEELGIDINKIADAKKALKLDKSIKPKLSKLLAEKELQSLKAKKLRLENKFSVEKRLEDIDIKLAKTDVDSKTFDTLIGEKLSLMIAKGDEQAIDDYVDQIAESVYRKVTGTDRYGVSMPYDVKIDVRGPAKERVLNFISDEELRPFLNTDITEIAQDYTRLMSIDIELKKKFGDINMTKQLAEIDEEYSTLISRATTEKQRIKLDKQLKETKRIINAFKDTMRGQYGKVDDPDAAWVKILQTSRILNYVSKLGGVVFSSFADTTRHIMIHGYGRVFNKGIKTLITNTKALKLSTEDARLAGQMWEAITHSRASLMADLNNPYSRNSKFMNFITWNAKNFSKVNGLDYWNNYQKGFSSLLTQSRLIDNIRKFDSLKPKERKYMAFLGIDSSNIEKLRKQIGKHSFNEEGFPIANLKKWTDDEALSLYKNALNTDVERTIVSKGVGDVPLFMNKEIGKTIMQFKSFAMAAHQQVTIATMQQADKAAVQGTITALIAGMMVYYMKSKAAGRKVSDDPNVWLAEAIDRSGLLPVLMEINGVADLAGFGVGRLTGQQPLSRFASRNKFSGLTGPTFGLAQDAFTVSRGISQGDLTEGDMKALRRNLPFQNLTYLRIIEQMLED